MNHRNFATNAFYAGIVLIDSTPRDSDAKPLWMLAAACFGALLWFVTLTGAYLWIV